MRTALESELSVTVQLLNGMPQPKEMTSSIIPVPSPEIKSKTESKLEVKTESEPKTTTKSDLDSNSQVSSISIKPISSDIPVKTISIDK